MDGTKATGKTIGEVEKLTGIPKWELKYYIERGFMLPSQRTESNYWLYTSEDIQKAQLISLCRTLNFPSKAILRILANPPSHWQDELGLQIVRLEGKLEHPEALLHFAKHLQYQEVWAALETYCHSLKEENAVLTAKQTKMEA